MRIRTRWLMAAALGLSLVSCRRDAGPIPKAEHPRPDFQRADWVNLNGEWEFRFDPQDLGIDQNWQNPRTPFDRRITVPFCWESKLSGVEDTSGQQVGWYRRSITVPAGWSGRRVWLRFDAVDWEARVWVNGRQAGAHEGGYTPFAFDITDHIKPGERATVVVRAFDPTDRELPTGKQVAFWYTFTSGIWQTVWLEARPATFLDELRLTPRNDGGTWSVEVEAVVRGPDGRAKVRFSSPDSTVTAADGEVEARSGAGEFRTSLAVASPKLWSPESPHLYDLTIEVAGEGGPADVVNTYFGLRTIGRGRYGNAAHESILLNGKPVYLRGALDQSFNPEGIHTAPSDEFLRRDMELAKSFGLNCLRIHIKPDEPRRLYWADKLGLLIMQDMPNTWEYSDRARQAWESTMRGAIARDRNHPSIFAWVLFNETWGIGNNHEYKLRPDIQQWVKTVFAEVKKTDPSRLVEDNSADKYDHVVTDINSWHFYIDDYEKARAHINEVVEKTFPGSAFNFAPGHRQDTAPLINSEYGAVSAGGGDRDISWGFRYLTNLLRRHAKIQGYIYTELTDVEFEHNGFVNYDRSHKEFGYEAFVDGMKVADLQGEDFVGFDTPPAIVAAPGADIEIPVWVSHFSEREGEIMLRPALVGVDDLGRDIKVELDSRPVTWERYRVTPQRPLEATLPKDRSFAGALTMELRDAAGKRIAANFVNVVAHRAEPRPAAGLPQQDVEMLGPRRVVLRKSPLGIHAARWTGIGSPARLARRIDSPKYFILGSGTIEYRFNVPKEVLDARPVRLGLLAELSTRARDEKVDWPQQVTPLDYPQTDGRKFPGTVNTYINGHPLDPVQLADDPADARGLLSHRAAFHHGSFGYLMRGELLVDGADGFLEHLRRQPVIRLVFEIPPGQAGRGLSVYGARSGRYPVDPTIILETEREIQPAK
ncbi:MAG: hypothetical protein KIT09_03365 [Bryobacteraceae bacterium]|nr:hypothetical protein [Bryobacteraceae bacterium]